MLARWCSVDGWFDGVCVIRESHSRLLPALSFKNWNWGEWMLGSYLLTECWCVGSVLRLAVKTEEAPSENLFPAC